MTKTKSDLHNFPEDTLDATEDNFRYLHSLQPSQSV